MWSLVGQITPCFSFSICFVICKRVHHFRTWQINIFLDTISRGLPQISPLISAIYIHRQTLLDAISNIQHRGRPFSITKLIVTGSSSNNILQAHFSLFHSMQAQTTIGFVHTKQWLIYHSTTNNKPQIVQL